MSVENVGTLFDVNRAINTHHVVILCVSAESWCVPCQRFAPHYNKVAELFPDSDVSFLKSDLDDSPDIAEQFGVLGVPTVVAFVGGHRVNNLDARTAVKLKSEIESLLETP
jgi:thioredoxin 1